MALGSSLGQFFLGSPSRLEQVSRYTPEQTAALNQVLGMGLQGLQDPYQGFEPIEKKARSSFAQQTIPSLAERFTSTGGALSSPSFASQIGQAGAGLEENLAALRSQYGLQNRAQQLNMLELGLTPQFEHYGLGAEPGFLPSLAQGALPQLTQYALAGGLGALGANAMGQSAGLAALQGAAPSVAAGAGGAALGNLASNPGRLAQAGQWLKNLPLPWQIALAGALGYGAYRGGKYLYNKFKR